MTNISTNNPPLITGIAQAGKGVTKSPHSTVPVDVGWIGAVAVGDGLTVVVATGMLVAVGHGVVAGNDRVAVGVSAVAVGVAVGGTGVGGTGVGGIVVSGGNVGGTGVGNVGGLAVTGACWGGAAGLGVGGGVPFCACTGCVPNSSTKISINRCRNIETLV